MSRRNSNEKIIPIDRGRKERKLPKDPEAARSVLLREYACPAQTHLLPVKFPYADPGCFLANVPRHQIGLEYFCEIRNRFPDASLFDDGYRSCTVSRIELGGPQEATDTARALVYDFDGRSFPLLRAQASGSHGSGIVEVANIIADPLGHDVFWHLIQNHANATFQTADYGHLPISSIDHATLWDLNFSE